MEENENVVMEEEKEIKKSKRHEGSPLRRIANLLIDSIEIIIGIAVVLLAVVGIVTLYEPELRVVFFKFLLEYSDWFKALVGVG